ncbi:hypothetical protein HPP92_006951 [Vanilla planifolia]|uniref:Uncharacterized protein n=1 Tax=Vanilla planifolia TaxID=51239 RepID=A0A835VA63_VANPL|nr:hypothetical protein HPP92_006951 [Vanilla planifolia]
MNSIQESNCYPICPHRDAKPIFWKTENSETADPDRELFRMNRVPGELGVLAEVGWVNLAGPKPWPTLLDICESLSNCVKKVPEVDSKAKKFRSTSPKIPISQAKDKGNYEGQAEELKNWSAGIAISPLSYYRCCDNLYQVRTIVDHQIRWSAIFTLAHKHNCRS